MVGPRLFVCSETKKTQRAFSCCSHAFSFFFCFNVRFPNEKTSRWQGYFDMGFKRDALIWGTLHEVTRRRNVFTVKRFQVVLITTATYYHWKEIGNIVLRTVFDNIEKPKLSIQIVPEKGDALVHGSILMRLSRFSRPIAAREPMT